MKLIDLLVKELPKRGGWPQWAARSAVYPLESRFIFFDDKGNSREGSEHPNIDIPNPFFYLEGRHVITRAQYESAIAKNDGWIEWGGGECPVDESMNVDIRFEDGSEKRDVPASAFIWQHGDDITTIIAYRPHVDINSRTNDDRLEQDLNECIGQAGEPKAWFPTVGEVCQARIGGEWTDVKVAYIGDEGSWNEALVFDVKSTKPVWADEFRPLRTEAEKARELGVSEMLKLMYGPQEYTYREICEIIYDAGYRKDVK